MRAPRARACLRAGRGRTEPSSTTRHARAALKSSPFASHRAASAEPFGLELRVVHVRGRPGSEAAAVRGASGRAFARRQPDPPARSPRRGQRSASSNCPPIGARRRGRRGAAGGADRRAPSAPGRVIRSLTPALDVATRGGRPAGAGEAIGRASRQLRSALVERARAPPGSDAPARGASRRSRRTRPGARRLRALEPVGKAGVEVGPRLLRSPRRRRRRGSGDGGIRSASSSRKSDRLGRTSSLRTSSSRRDGIRTASAGRRQLREGADIEGLAHHRRAAEHGTLVGAEELEARREQRVDPGRDSDVVEVADGDPAAVDRIRARPSSMSIEIICSMKSGLPSARPAT